MADDASVLLLVGGEWQQLTDEPGNLVLSANEWGSDRCTFDLVRDTTVPWRDITANTPVRVEVASVPVWSGSIKETPARDRDTITVEAQGWQYSLDEVPYLKNYVHSKIRNAAWERPKALSGVFGDNGTAESSGPFLRMAYMPGDYMEAGTGTGLTLDLGDTDGVKRVVVTYTMYNPSAITLDFYVRNHSDLAHTTSEELATSVNASGSGTIAHTFTTARRCLSLFLYRPPAAGSATMADGVWARIWITSVKIFSDTTYESGNASVLNPDEVIKDALAEGGTLLSSDQSQISASSTVLDHCVADWQAPREVIEAVNEPQGWITKIDPESRMVFKARPTTPKFILGSWSGYEWSDASLNNSENLLSSVIVNYTNASTGDRAWTERTQTLTALNGRPRRRVIDVGSPISTTVAQAIGDAYLSLHSKTALHATVTIAGPEAIRGSSGGAVHPAVLLRETTELVRIEDHIDPDTGGLGRIAKVATVTYSHPTRAASIELDSSRREHEALLERYGISP